jgi:hypothetical protein
MRRQDGIDRPDLSGCDLRAARVEKLIGLRGEGCSEGVKE